MSFLSLFQFAGLFLFVSLFAGVTLHLRKNKKINALKLNIANKRIYGILELSLIAVVTVWALEVVMYAGDTGFRIFPSPFAWQLIHSPTFEIAGVALVILGFTICILALRALGTSWRLGIDERTPGDLVTDGIYAISRNPIYLFFSLYFIGTFLINGTLIFLIFAAFVAANLQLQIFEEEKFLAKTYGLAYQRYCAATRQYFTWQKLWHKQASFPS